MKEIVIISGKGGTGKTSIVASFAALSNNAVLADCDVDAADLHLILKPKIQQENDFVGGKRARIITEKCTGCGKCSELCRFDAIMCDNRGNGEQKLYEVEPVSCEGCGVCVEFCPADAIAFEDAVNGRWFISETRFGPMVHAKLGIAEENSGKLVSVIRKEAKRIALEQRKELVLVDGSPGIGCPVIASITGADVVLIVTEPTMSAQHDFRRVAELAAHFNIPTLVCINKYDINEGISDEIESQARESSIKTVGRIPYDTAVTKAQLQTQSVVEYSDNSIAQNITSVWENVLKILNHNLKY